jgi:glycosyltransferase involved in cell wall biosynthesis
MSVSEPQPHLKIAFIAPSCDGTDVGEAWSSFQWAKGLAERFELTVLSHRKRGRMPLAEQLPSAEVIEWPDSPLAHRWERFSNSANPAYISFYFKARRWLRESIAEGRKFDIVHQISPLSLRYPSPALGLGIPFILGPLAGSLNTPREFLSELRSAPLYTYLRGIDGLRIKYDPLLRRTFEEPQIVMGVAPYVKDLLHSVALKRFEVMNETGVVELPEIRHEEKETGRCRLLYVGRITRTKGVRDAIRALSRVSASLNVTFDIVGDGDDRALCEDEVRTLNLAHCITFHGRRPRSEVDTFYQNADVFLFPSFREPSGNVVLEAMSFGLPLIVAERGGPGFVVGDDHGIRVPVTTPSEYAERLCSAIVSLASNPDLRSRMGRIARERISETHIWSRKIDAVSELYKEVAMK